MPVLIECDSCGRKLRVREELLGKRVKCPGCQTIFLAEGTSEEQAEDEDERVTSRRRPAPDDDDEDEESRTPARRRDREDDEDDEPPRRRVASRDDDDEDDEEEDRPRRRRRRAPEVNKAKILAPAITMAVMGGIGVLISLYMAVSSLSGLSQVSSQLTQDQIRQKLQQDRRWPTMSDRQKQDAMDVANTGVGVVKGFAWTFVIGGFLYALINLLIILGSVMMMMCKSRGLAITASILSILNLACFCLPGVGVGIWSMVILNQADVKRAFS